LGIGGGEGAELNCKNLKNREGGKKGELGTP